jgi:peptidoglycan/LPS O-acetylase OafA/YrhL
MKIAFPRNNNLEWLRLIFAVQVVFCHSSSSLKFEIPSFISHFPGVPAFFFVSGFLIYASYLNAPGRRYFENRFLRIYPALVLVTLGGGGIVLLAHGWNDLINNFSIYALWFIAQTTLGQAYNPGLFRDVGIGVINGSLWTITTEILFYLCVPLIVWLERRFRYTVFVLVVISFSLYAVGPLVWSNPIYRDKTFYDIIGLTPIVWGWMFGLGILVVKNFDFLKRWFSYLPLAVIPITVMIFIGDGHYGVLFGSSGNQLGLFYFVNYVSVVLWFSFVVRPVRLSFDLSYGVYIWHQPVLNLLLVLGLLSFPLALVLTMSIAALSWFCVEKQFLKLKRQSLKAVGNEA